jgi:hypothetical protein
MTDLTDSSLFSHFVFAQVSCFVCGEHGGQPWFSGSYAWLWRAKVRRGGFSGFASIGSAQNPAFRSGNSLPSNFRYLSFYLD